MFASSKTELLEILGAKRWHERPVNNNIRFPDDVRHIARGPGGRLAVFVKPDGSVRQCSFNSCMGATYSRTFDKDFISNIARHVEVHKVWHKGAVALCKEFEEQIPQFVFPHEIVRVYGVDRPFLDIMTEDKETLLLRMDHRGFFIWDCSSDGFVSPKPTYGNFADYKNVLPLEDDIKVNRNRGWQAYGIRILNTPNASVSYLPAASGAYRDTQMIISVNKEAQ